MSNIKPCPFCGSTNVQIIDGSTFRWRLAQCQSCGSQAGDVRIQTAGEGTPLDWEARAVRLALDEWNKRAQGDEGERLRRGNNGLTLKIDAELST